MASLQGVVSILNDPISGAVPASAWMTDLAGLSPAPHHVLVRAPISVDASGAVNLQSLTLALQNYQQAGFEVWPVLHGDLEIGYQRLKGQAFLDAMPNAPLGLHGDMLQNAYINAYSLRVISILQQLGGACPSTVFLWNEPNLDNSTLAPGVIPKKPSSLAPEVFAALLSTTAKRIRATVPQVKRIIPGALSCLAQFYTDPHGPWVEGYLQKTFAYLHQYGIDAPYQFSDMCLNLEGVVPDAYVQGCTLVARNIIDTFGLTGTTIAGEWGIANATIAAQHLDMTATWQSLTKHFGVIFAFSHNTELPTSTGGYGMTTWTINPQGLIVPTDHTPMYTTFQRLLTTLH